MNKDILTLLAYLLSLGQYEMQRRISTNIIINTVCIAETID